MAPSRYWRIRMKVQGWLDRSEAAWERGEVGLWYGAWSATDWQSATKASPTDPWASLRNLPHQRALGWGAPPDIAAVQRFQRIAPDDWVVVYLRSRAEIGLARLEEGIQSDEHHPLNERVGDGTGTELFKYRRIAKQKTFKIAELPDAYLLLAAQGRGNVHEFHGMRGHVELLAESNDIRALRAFLKEIPFEQLIDVMGASAWESISTAYLTLEHQFVPTGLSTGGTLADFDIVGRRVPDGTRIFAQCKKNPGPVVIDPEFANAIREHAGNSLVFYFSYGGCRGGPPPGVQVIGRKEILDWIQTERGAMYRKFLDDI